MLLLSVSKIDTLGDGSRVDGTGVVVVVGVGVVVPKEKKCNLSTFSYFLLFLPEGAATSGVCVITDLSSDANIVVEVRFN